MKKRKLLSILVVGAMAVSMIAGCGSVENPDAEKEASGDVEMDDVSAAVDEAVKEAGTTGDITIGYSTPSLALEFCANLERAVQEACEERGYELVVLDCDMDGSTQVSQCEDLVNQGVDAILIFPIAPDACASIGTECEEAGIPLVTVESVIDTYTAAVVTDMYAVGEAQANKAIEICGDNVKPAILQGPTSQTTLIELKDGAVETFKAADIEVADIQIGENSIDTSQQVVENWISSGLEFNCIIASSDGSAAGAINALKDADLLDDVVVVSENGDSIGLELIQAGDLACTVYLPSTRYGYEGIGIIEKILNGESYDEITTLSIDWIDASNVADYIE